MGWRPIGPQGQAVAGDDPVDAMAKAAGRIAEAYHERFGRPPLLAEVLHALRTVLAADPDLVLDPERIESDVRLTFPGTVPPALDRYEGSFSEEPPPDGTYFVTDRDGRDVLTCRLRVDGRTLLVDHTVLDAGLDDAEARRIIGWVLLREFTGDHHRPLVDRVSFASTAAPEARTVVPYAAIV